MTQRLIPETSFLSFDTQTKEANKHGYKIPTLLQGAICICAAHVKGVQLYSNESDYMHCQEALSFSQISLGSNAEGSINFEFNDYYCRNGVAGIKTFE